jgi:hypothetical protein
MVLARDPGHCDLARISQRSNIINTDHRHCERSEAISSTHLALLWAHGGVANLGLAKSPFGGMAFPKAAVDVATLGLAKSPFW